VGKKKGEREKGYGEKVEERDAGNKKKRSGD